MPSKSEPCGLSQMIACRYGTVPVVRETGGLYDSIKPVSLGGNGFTFANYNAYDMLYVIREAIACYQNKEFWPELVKRVMTVISVGSAARASRKTVSLHVAEIKYTDGEG